MGGGQDTELAVSPSPSSPPSVSLVFKAEPQAKNTSCESHYTLPSPVKTMSLWNFPQSISVDFATFPVGNPSRYRFVRGSFSKSCSSFQKIMLLVALPSWYSSCSSNSPFSVCLSEQPRSGLCQRCFLAKTVPKNSPVARKCYVIIPIPFLLLLCIAVRALTSLLLKITCTGRLLHSGQ